jgi:two-component system sensor histidine kinase HydH
MNLLAQTALLVALTSLGMGLSVLPRQLQNKLMLSFSAACSVVFAWSLLFFLEKVFGGGWFYYFHLLSGIWLGPACLYFIRVWIGRAPSGWTGRLSQAVWTLSWLSSVGLSVAWLGFWPQGGIAPSFLRDLMFFSPAPVVLQLLVILATRRPLPLREGVVFGGALAVLSLSTLDHVPWLGHVVPSLGNLLLCIYLILLGQAIRQQKLVDVPLLVTRFAVLLVLALLLTGLYLTLVSWIEHNPVLFFLNSFAASFLIVNLINPLQRWISALTDRVLASRDAEWRTRLERAMLEVRTASGISEWQNALAAGLEGALSCSAMKLVLIHRDIAERSSLLLDEIQSRREQGRLTILVDSLLQAEISRSSDQKLNARLEAVRAELRRGDFNAVLPVFDRRILGWVLVRLEMEGPGAAPKGLRTWRQLREVEEYLGEAGRNLALLLRIHDEAERERLATLGEMAAGLAHEIRNPLGAIQGAAQLLPETSELGPWTRIIREEVGRLNHVVSQFLVYSRKSPVESGCVEIGPWMKRSIERLRSGCSLSHPGTPVMVREWSDSGTPLAAEMDPEAIYRVLENLVHNSIQAGATEIEISSGTSADSQAVILEIRDNGRGIAPADFSKLFVPFFTTNPAGTGLGLSISQRIVESHGGRIEAVEVRGRGACFRIRLPLGGSE